MKKVPYRFFSPGDLIQGVPWGSEYVQYPMKGIVLGESDRSTFVGDVFVRWYRILTEEGRIVEELERLIEPV